MQSAPWKHPSGKKLNCWVTKSDIENIVIPQLNEIYDTANIYWEIESILEEEIVEFEGYQTSIDYVLNAVRNKNGKSGKRCS